MAELIVIRRRIKAVETTKKIAYAMQLIAMGLHARLKPQQILLEGYIEQLRILLRMVKLHAPAWKNKILHPPQNLQTPHHLIILIGSQRGLCGNLNTNLIHTYNTHISKLNKETKVDVIIIGNKLLDHFQESLWPHAIKVFTTFGEHDIGSIAEELSHFIMVASPLYQSIVIISSESKKIFIQKPRVSSLVPLSSFSGHLEFKEKDFEWYLPPEYLLDALVPLIIEGTLHSLLFEAFLAEQAARFVSMDFSTRNAQKMLASLQLHYNKLRQASITQELIELSTALTI